MIQLRRLARTRRDRRRRGHRLACGERRRRIALLKGVTTYAVIAQRRGERRLAGLVPPLRRVGRGRGPCERRFILILLDHVIHERLVQLVTARRVQRTYADAE